MTSLRSIAFAAALLAAFAATAQTAAEHAAHHPAGAASSAPATTPSKTGGVGAMGERAAMAQLDAHMKAMQAMHDKMAAARTPEGRQALMAEHMKLMEDGMAMMQSMMQMMMDRMQAPAPASK